MSKPNVTRVQSATQWTASVHSLHMSKPNVTRVQSATERTASVHTLHMSKPNVTRVQSATERTASVLLRTAKCYSTTTPVLLVQSLTPVLLQYYSVLQSTTPLLLRTTKCYSSTTPYCKVLLHYYPSTTLYHKVLLLLCTTNQNNQPASQPASLAGRPANTVRATWKRPAGRLARSRPAGRGRNSEQIHGAVIYPYAWNPFGTNLSFVLPPKEGQISNQNKGNLGSRYVYIIIYIYIYIQKNLRVEVPFFLLTAPLFQHLRMPPMYQLCWCLMMKL